MSCYISPNTFALKTSNENIIANTFIAKNTIVRTMIVLFTKHITSVIFVFLFTKLSLNMVHRPLVDYRICYIYIYIYIYVCVCVCVCVNECTNMKKQGIQTMVLTTVVLFANI